ncbi:MAG: hypothetical protein ACOYIR_02500 [Christensenellales bacterium]|jgi:hypothetical protein
MNIADLVASFVAGIAAAGFGGVQFFIICAGTCLFGALLRVDTTGIAFSPLLNPASTFLPAAVAAGYANYKGYNGGGNGPAASLMALQKPDVLLLAGVAGVLGWAGNWALGQIGLGGFDTIAATVVIIPLVFKVIFQKTALGVVPDEDKAIGGRFSPLGGRGWYAGMRRGIDKAIWPAAYGAVMGIAMVLLMQAGSPAAGVIGFGFGGFVLLFPTVPAQHFIGCAVCTALGFVPNLASNPDAILIAVAYGFGFGALAANLADLSSDLFFRYGYVHIDIPAGSIAASTLIIALLAKFAPDLFAGVALPIVIWVLCLAYGLFYDAKWKKFAASKGLAY